MPLSDADTRAICSWDANQEPWHLEPPSNGAAEEQKEQDWSYLAADVRRFVQLYGLSDLHKCLAEAMSK